MTDHGLVNLAIIGGGVNGAGIARDAAGRGLKVLLCEKGDLAEGTSSRSGKLVHGGLRYLEYYEFRLVREALIEREVLLNAAPHIIWPMRFVLPHSPEQRPAWLIRLGLFLYDSLGGRKRLPGARKLDLRTAPEGKTIKPEFSKAFEYSDCWVDDARLVVLNALDAKAKGATILTRTAAASARRAGALWELELRGADAAGVLCGRRRLARLRQGADGGGQSAGAGRFASVEPALPSEIATPHPALRATLSQRERVCAVRLISPRFWRRPPHNYCPGHRCSSARRRS